MKKVVTWIARDGEEFATEEECYAYEHRFDKAAESVVFLDEDFNVIPWDLEKIYDEFHYIVILNTEKAPELFDAIEQWERCFEIPVGYVDNDILEWDGKSYGYINLKKERREIEEKIARAEKGLSYGTA